MKARGGFTLIEVMVALVIISTVTTAALKLCALSEISLAEVKEERALLRDALTIKAGILLEEIDSSGASGDIEWDCISGKREMMGEDFGNLYLGKTKVPINFDMEWRDLKVTRNYTPDKQRSIILCIEKDNIKKSQIPESIQVSNEQEDPDKQSTTEGSNKKEGEGS